MNWPAGCYLRCAGRVSGMDGGVASIEQWWRLRSLVAKAQRPVIVA
jgi:hypothetical protein